MIFSGFHLRPKVKLVWKILSKKEDRQDQITKFGSTYQIWDPGKMLSISDWFSHHDLDAFSKKRFQLARHLTPGREAMKGVRIRSTPKAYF